MKITTRKTSAANNNFKSILIITHFFTMGPGTELKDYLLNKTSELHYIKHPFSFSVGDKRSSNLQVYKKNNEKYFNKQSSILEKYKLFFSDPKKLFENPVVGFGMLFMKTCEFGAGGIGYLCSFIK